MDLALTVREFCAAHRISQATFYELVKRGDGPKVMKVGRSNRISLEAAEEWRRKMEERPASHRARGAHE